MVRAVQGAGACVPGVLAEEEREEGEEEAGDLKPEGAADMQERAGEGLAESAGSFTHAARALAHAAGGLGDFFGAEDGGVRGAAALLGWGLVCDADGAEAWAARSFAMREATRTPMPSLRPKRCGSMGKVYREHGSGHRDQA